MRAAFLAIACLGLSACPKPQVDGTNANASTAGSSAGGGLCSPLHGIYRFSYAEVSGSCGPQPDELLEFRNGRSITSPALNCQAGGEAMVNACELRRDSMCAVSDPSTGALLGHIHVTGVLTEVGDNTRVQGTLAVATINTAGGGCQGTYDVIGLKTR